jgi:hypothetical protein
MTCYSSANKITHEEWLETDYCECSKPVFKYHDITNNVFVLKCKNGNVSVTGNVHENVSNVSNVSKAKLKLQVKEYLEQNKEFNCYELINKFVPRQTITAFLGIPSTEENLSNQSIEELMSKLNMKRYLNRLSQ